MKLFAQAIVIARIEARFYARYPKLLIATLAVALIPALYAVIYLSSVWDPAANTGNLAVALVNLDLGMEYREHTFSVGREVVVKLKARRMFGYRDFTSEQEAREQVRQGKLAFALIIPSDFSSNAVPGAEAGGGKLVVYTSEGNSYQSAGLARRFAEDLGHEVNESLNERRWALVLSNAVGSQRSMDRLRDGVNQLRAGAQELVAGTTRTAAGAESLTGGARRLNQGVVQLTGGTRELGIGLRTMDARRPRNSELTRLKAGAEALAAGQGELGLGLIGLKEGTQRMTDGVAQARTELKSSLFASTQVTEGVNQLADGLVQIDSGLQAAVGTQKKLAEGTDQLNAGVGTLINGVQGLTGGIRRAVTRLPDDSLLDEMNGGASRVAAGSLAMSDNTKQINAGARHLASGIDLLAGALPVATPRMDGSAEGLANSVRPLMEVEDAVQNNGTGFAPNIIPAALWLGAGIAAFLIHVRVLPRQALFFSRPAQMLGKIAIPAAVVLLQAVLVLLLVMVVLKIQVADPPAFALTLGVASLSFLFIVFALTRAFGDAGKALAMIFLAVQLSSSGGILPVELSGGLFADISPWLPLTWVVRAIKASMFGAFDGAWQPPLQLVSLAGLAAALMACYVGRWRFVKQSAMRPAVEF
jgi:putative membrane protein